MSWLQWLHTAITSETQAEDMDATADEAEQGDPEGAERGEYQHWRMAAAEARALARCARQWAAKDWRTDTD